MACNCTFTYTCISCKERENRVEMLERENSDLAFRLRTRPVIKEPVTITRYISSTTEEDVIVPVTIGLTVLGVGLIAAALSSGDERKKGKRR